MKRIGDAPTRAQQPAPMIDSLAQAINDLYVFADQAPRVAESLRRMAASGLFASAGNSQELADLLTREVRTLMNGDGHFRVLAPRAATELQAYTVGASGGRPAQGGAPPASSGGSAPIVMSRGAPPGGAPAAGADPMRSRTEAERRAGHYFRSVERLPGNVVRIVLDQFAFPTDEARAAASAVLQLAATADAVILDVRINPGGSEGLNQYISSHFFPADTQKILYNRYQRRGNLTNATRVLGSLPGRRMPTTPLFIVTSRGTVSAAENLTYTLQKHERATVVGERTSGAANSSQIFSLPDGYSVQMPTARVVHPMTGTNWEGTGVVPDVAVAPLAAPGSAYALALRKLAEMATDSTQRTEVLNAQRRLAALAEPREPAAIQKWVEYAGRYGLSEVRIEAGRLVTQAFGADGDPGAVLTLRPLGGDDFLIDGLPGVGTMPIRFVRDSTGAVAGRRVFSFVRYDWVTTPRSR